MFIVVFLGFVTIWAYYVSKQWKFYKLSKQIPGPLSYPVIGTTYAFVHDFKAPIKIIRKFSNQYGNRFLIWLGPRPVVVLNNVEDIEKVCSSTELIGKGHEYALTSGWLGNGLITSGGPLWAHRRKLLTPCFHFAVLDKFHDPINKQAFVLRDTLKREFCEKELGFQDILPFMHRCALDTICETSMGTEMNAQECSTSSAKQYAYALERLGELIFVRLFSPWLYLDFIWSLTKYGSEEKACCEVLCSTTDKVITERRQFLGKESQDMDESQDRRKTRKLYRPLLDLLLEAQERDPLSISDAGLRDEITTFIFAGHDTVATALSFCLYALGNNPQVLAKAHAELFSIFGDDKTRPVTSADLKRLKYLDLIFKESLRLYPSVPYIARQTATPFRLDKNLILPPGTGIQMLPLLIHRNPKYWPNPTKFIPERFDPDNPTDAKISKSPFAYIPFSAGSRNCIGMKLAVLEAKIILAVVLRNFNIISEKPESELDLVQDLVLRARGGLNIKLQPR